MSATATTLTRSIRFYEATIGKKLVMAVTGAILTILPIGIATMMMFVSPSYMMVLYNHPLGKTLITAAIVCLVLAHYVIRKLVDIKI